MNGKASTFIRLFVLVSSIGLVSSCSRDEANQAQQGSSQSGNTNSSADVSQSEAEFNTAISLASANASAPIEPMNEAEFRAELRKAFRDSQLSPIEKAQHVMDRLSYGQHPIIMPISALLSYNRDGSIDAAATDSLIINYIVESMNPEGYPAAYLEPVVASFPQAGFDYAQISDRLRKLNKWIVQAEFTYSNRNDFIRSVQSGQMTVPAQTLQDAIAERDRASETSLNHKNARARMRFALAKLERARFITHAISR